jgi:hypothetical protein
LPCGSRIVLWEGREAAQDGKEAVDWERGAGMGKRWNNRRFADFWNKFRKWEERRIFNLCNRLIIRSYKFGLLIETIMEIPLL